MRLPKLILIVVISLSVVSFAVYLHATRPQSNPKSFTNQTNPFFKSINETLPEADWSRPKNSSIDTIYGKINGLEETGRITSDQASIRHFEDQILLNKMGYNLDLNLAAAGPGAEVWGYIKKEGNKYHAIIYSYQVTPTKRSENQPIQFKCPCNVDLKTFVSVSFEKKKSE